MKCTHTEEEEDRDHFRSVISAFFNYQVDAMQDVLRMERNFSKLKQEHQSRLPYPISQRVSRLKEALTYNYIFLVNIVHSYKELFDHTELVISTQPDGRLQLEKLSVSYKNITKMRSTVRQLVRDWSSEGKHERDLCYKPIISELQHNFPQVYKPNGDKVSVLVPGAGLGRLSFEIVKLGYKTQGNEFSYFMLVASDFMLNKTIEQNQFKIYPFIHDFTNIYKLDDVFREILIPDVVPGDELGEDTDFSMVAGEFVEIYSAQPAAWDCIVTCYFIDTASNILKYIETIHKALVPGGVWINFGPLLYHYAEMEEECSIDLSWEELRHAILNFGFRITQESIKESLYAAELNSMLEVRYKCIFFTAIKE